MATPSKCPQRLVRRPPSSSTAAPASGNAISSHAARCTPAAAMVVMAGATTACATASEPLTALPPVLARGDNPPEPPGKDQTGGHRGSIFQQVRIIYRRRLAGAEDGHQDGQAHHDLGGGHHHHEERDDLAIQRSVHPREGDEREVDSVQHELDTHEHDHRVAAHQHADRADHEEDHGKRHEVSRAHDRASSCSVVDRAVPACSGPASSPRPSWARRAAITGLTESPAGLPSGSRAGMSTALCRAYVPGPGSGAGRLLATRSLDRLRWVGLGEVRSRCASTMAPSPAVMSRALVASNGNTYRVKIRRASPVMFDVPKEGFVAASGARAACPTTRLSSTSRPIPTMPAASRWPLMVSTRESAALTPTIISTKRKSISTAPVYTITWTKARNGAFCKAYRTASESITTASSTAQCTARLATTMPRAATTARTASTQKAVDSAADAAPLTASTPPCITPPWITAPPRSAQC